MFRDARTSGPYAKTVVIKQMLFPGKFGHGDLLQMLIKQKTWFWLMEFTTNENSFIHLLMMKINNSAELGYVVYIRKL